MAHKELSVCWDWDRGQQKADGQWQPGDLQGKKTVKPDAGSGGGGSSRLWSVGCGNSRTKTIISPTFLSIGEISFALSPAAGSKLSSV